MVRVAFVIGGYPPEEHKRRADVALSYATAEIQVGIVEVAASPYFYGMTPTEIQLVAPAFIDIRVPARLGRMPRFSRSSSVFTAPPEST
mgnify:CR=1 FL=1